jgi:hypothetical protein
MKSIPLRSCAAFAVLLSGLFATAAFATQSAPAEAPKPAPAEAESDAESAKDETKDTAETPEAEPEDERICRHIRLDMSSRRKTKICRTTEEWRELGNPR